VGGDVKPRPMIFLALTPAEGLKFLKGFLKIPLPLWGCSR